MRKGELTRGYIIETCAPIFNQLGYANTSMSKIMEATGLEKGCLYGHFKNKEELAVEVFDYSINEIFNLKFLPLRQLECGHERLIQFIYGFCHVKSPIPGGCPIFNTAVEQDNGNCVLKKRAIKNLNEWVDELVSYIELAKKNKIYRSNIEPRSIAVFILSSLEGGLIAYNLTKQNTLELIEENLIQYLNQLKK